MEPLPKTFEYVERTRILIVEYVDGSIIKYFDVHPDTAFLQDANPRRNRDFLAVKQNYRSEVVSGPTGTAGTPQTRPVASEQKPQTKLTFMSNVPWGTNPIGKE
jgi:hypothetical protein